MSAAEILPYDYQEYGEWFIKYYRSKGRYSAIASHDTYSSLKVATSGPGSKKWIECNIIVEIDRFVKESIPATKGPNQ